MRVGQWPKRLLVYRASALIPIRRIRLTVGGLDVLGTGSQFVGFGTHPTTGRPYEWIGSDTPINTALEDAPAVSPHLITSFLEQALSLYSLDHVEQELRTGTYPPYENARETSEGRILCRISGLITDGRDEHLRDITWKIWCEQAGIDAGRLAKAAWIVFARTTDLRRPAHDGTRRWSPADALAKAQALLRRAERNAVKRAKRARLKPLPRRSDIPEELRHKFRDHCRELHQVGRMKNVEWRVSDMMLDRLLDGRCIDSVAFIAAKLHVSAKTVQRARRGLLASGLWSTGRRLGSRNQTAPYFPSPSILAQLTEVIELSSVEMAKMSPNTKGIVGGQESAARLPAPIIPHQTLDARQVILFPNLNGNNDIRLVVENWRLGPLHEAVRG